MNGRAMGERAPIRLEPWGEDDLPLVQRLMGDPAMTEHLGGPESPEKLAERQERYARPGSGMFKVVDQTGDAVGSVGFWEREWRGQKVYEIGWYYRNSRGAGSRVTRPSRQSSWR